MNQSPKPVDLSEYLSRPNEPELELLRRHHPNEQLIIMDIGACEGEDSVRYARRFRQARIFTFEPLPANQALIRANFLRYAVSNAELVPLALSDRRGESKFHVSSGRPPNEFAGPDWNYGNKSSSLLAPASDQPMYGWIQFNQSITVQTETLDRFCIERNLHRIDFIHMDVQGAERLVLAGAEAILPRVGAIWLEVSDQELYDGQLLRKDMVRLLKRRGFALAFEVRREVEGDQFYVNLRFPTTWRHLAFRRAAELISRTRQLAGRMARGVSSRSPLR